jgi:creatinine amidohydrolase
MTAMPHTDLSWLTGAEVAAAAAADVPVVVCVGATEQHGPHLPVGTDVILPVAIATEAARRIPLLVAPPITYGAHSRPLVGGGESFPGTVSVRASVLMPQLTQVLQGLARSGFRQVVVHNWHLENAGFLWEACDLALDGQPGLRILLLENPFPPFTPEELAELFPDGFVGWEREHASMVETSLMMVVRPDLVRTHLVADDRSARFPSWDLLPAPPDYLTASGVLAEPSRATTELGRRLLAACVERLVEAVTTEFGTAASR